MNKRLLLSLYDRSGLGAYMPVDYKGHELAVEEHMKKFAELIVRECISMADKESERYSNLDQEYCAMAMDNYRELVRKHFGVEE